VVFDRGEPRRALRCWRPMSCFAQSAWVMNAVAMISIPRVQSYRLFQ